jgi:2-polyprenyl-6-methoxyphenol hydroxylase-like FAD-dependent oxidoreductase
MIHNIPQPVLEHHLSVLIAEDPNITLVKGFSIHAVKQVGLALLNLPLLKAK